MAPNASITATADVKLSPQGSHTVLTLLGLLAGISMLLAAFLMYVDRPASGAAFLLSSIGAGIALVWCWSRSQRDVDLGGAVPTTIDLANGTSISTDSRLLSTVDGMRSFGELIDTVATRQPLPPPSGLISSDGKLIDGSCAEAEARVAQINQDLTSSTEQALNELRAALEGPAIAQQPSNTNNPMLPSSLAPSAGGNVVAPLLAAE